MTKIFYISLFLCSFLSASTGIITSKGFDGIGFWTTIDQPFAESDKISYDFQIDFYSAIGLEFNIGTIIKENSDPINRIGVGYHFKLTDYGFISTPFGFMAKYSKNTINDFRFSSDDVYYDELDVAFYRTGKLNPFVEFISRYYENDYTNEQFLRFGGLGRVKRFLTFSCSLKIPVAEKFDIGNGYIETSIGIDFNWINKLLF